MKNYLCLNGKKTELTDEQLKQLGIVKEPLATITKDGKLALIGDYEFIVLNKNEETVELLLKDILYNRKFDSNTNNFSESDIREYLDDFADIISKVVGEENIIKHNVDLTSLDGLKDYGSCDCRVSLLTAKQYAENVYKIDEFKIDKWWWLATPYSTPKHDIETLVSCVSSFGNVDYDSFLSNIGVRPFCILKSNIFISK